MERVELAEGKLRRSDRAADELELAELIGGQQIGRPSIGVLVAEDSKESSNVLETKLLFLP